MVATETTAAEMDAKTAAEAEAQAAFEAATLAVIEKNFAEIMEALKWSPPALVAWSFGFLDSLQMICVLVLCLLPWGCGKAVDMLGGRGAWAPKIASSKQSMIDTAEAWNMQALILPTSIWIGPFIMMSVFRDESASQLSHGLMLAGVYIFLCAANYAKEKYFPTAAAKQPEDESSKKTKAKGGSGSSKKQR